MSAQEILVVPAPNTGPVAGEKGLFSGAPAPVKLNVQVLSDNLKRFVDSIAGFVSSVPKSNGPFDLEEIEFTVEVNAEGSFQLIGGAKAGVTGGLTLKLKRAK